MIKLIIFSVLIVMMEQYADESVCNKEVRKNHDFENNGVIVVVVTSFALI